MAAQEDSIPTAGGSNDEINRVRHQPFRNKGARPKQPNRGTKQTNQRRQQDSRQQQERRHEGDTTAICYRCGQKGHYGKSCEKNTFLEDEENEDQ